MLEEHPDAATLAKILKTAERIAEMARSALKTRHDLSNAQCICATLPKSFASIAAGVSLHCPSRVKRKKFAGAPESSRIEGVLNCTGIGRA
jgi:hypothetical protein